LNIAPHFFNELGDLGLSGKSAKVGFTATADPPAPAIGAAAPTSPFVEAREAYDGFWETPALGGRDSVAVCMDV
jgi:hypothetical protein